MKIATLTRSPCTTFYHFWRQILWALGGRLKLPRISGTWAGPGIFHLFFTDTQTHAHTFYARTLFSNFEEWKIGTGCGRLELPRVSGARAFFKLVSRAQTRTHARTHARTQGWKYRPTKSRRNTWLNGTTKVTQQNDENMMGNIRIIDRTILQVFH